MLKIYSFQPFGSFVERYFPSTQLALGPLSAPGGGGSSLPKSGELTGEYPSESISLSI